MSTQVPPKHDTQTAELEPQLLAAVDQHKWRTLIQSRRFIFFAFFSYLAIVVDGFDLSGPGAMLAMTPFDVQFGYLYQGAYVVPALYQALWTGLTSLGECVGALATTPISNRYGRKWVYFLSSCISIIGIAIQMGSRNWYVLMIGRFVNGIAIGALLTFAPLYCGENSFPEVRGVFLVCIVSAIVWGQLFSTFTARWCSILPGDAGWLTLIGLQFIFPLLTMMLMPWFPESPYWLMMYRNDNERARKNLERLYGGKSHPDLVERRYNELLIEVKASRELALATQEITWRDCFRGSNSRRTWLAFWGGSIGQVQGTSFIFGYITYFTSLLKVSNPFNISVLVFCLAFLGNTMCYWAIERFGRRTLMVWGTFTMTIFLLLIGGLGFIGTQNTAATQGITGLLVIWAFIYELSVGPASVVYASEVSDLSLRGYTQPLVTLGHALLGWVFGFFSPYLINPDEAALGAKVGLVFGATCFLSLIWCYMYAGETKGLTNTEITYLFNKKTSYRHFQREIKLHRARLAAQGEHDITGDEMKETSRVS